MIIYVRDSDNIVMGMETEDTTCPAGCSEFSVEQFPVFWTTGGYTYTPADGFALTPRGVEYMSEMGVSMDVHFTDPRIEERRIAALWEAAKAHQENQLDSNGLIGMQFKAVSGGTKAAANVAWVQSIWDEYYSRRQSVATNTDYSICGDLPYNYYDAINEEV